MTAPTTIDRAIAQVALRHSESRYRRLFETAQDGILLLNAVSGQIEDVNPYLINMLGYSHEQFLGKKLWEVGAFADIAQSKQMFAELQTKGYVRLDNLPLKTRSGKSIDVEFVSNSYSCEGIKVIQCNIRDISDRNAAEAEARLRTRLYTALSSCNKAIVHCTSEAELFPRVCQIVVQLGGMRMAWIGLVDADSGLVRPVASFGDDTGYLQDIRISASADSPYGRGPTGTAVRTNRPAWADDAETSVDVAPWSELRARSGFTASVALPLRRNGAVIGALSVYMDEARTFNLTTRELLTEIATDISFAVTGFAREALRARAEAAVNESEAQLAFTERVSHTGGWSFDRGDHSSRRTLEHDRIFGYSAPLLQWTRKDFLEHVIPEDRAEAARKFREFLANGSALNLECRIRRVDGELRWIRVLSSDGHAGAGANGRLSGMVQDITERKQIEQGLYESQQRLAGVLSSAMDAIVTAEASGAVVLSNPAAARMFGYTSEELQQLSIDKLMPRRYRTAHAVQVARFGRSGTTSRNLGNPRPIRGLRRNGEEFPLEASVSIDTSTGRPLYTAILRDITARERAMAAIEESRHRLELATDSACMGIWDWNLTAQELAWDPRMYALYGLEDLGAGDALAAWHAGVHPEDRAHNDAAVAAALAGSKDFNVEFRVVWPNGEVRHLEGHAIVQHDAGGAATRMTGVNWDITQRKRANIRVSYLNRVFSVLSRINTLIVHVRDRGQLFQEACNMAVTTGGFGMAQIGMAAAAGGTVQVLASASKQAPYATAAANIASPDAAELSMMSRAIHTGRALVANDSEHDPLVPHCAAHAAGGIRSFAVLPLIIADKAVGAIALYATEKDFFHPEEMELLAELADDVAFAIGHIQQQERLEYLAYFDDLTELANRAQFLEQAAKRMAAAAANRSGMVLLLIDLERFRDVNDSLDRATGDLILQQVAQWLTLTVDSGCLVARVGPDHFAVLQPGAPDNATVARRVADLLGAFLQHPFRAREADFRMAAKAGVALYPDHGTDPETLLRHAEVALEQAKVVGERFLVYTLEMTKAVAGRLRLETQLRHAVENEEFVLHYQPKISIATGALTGAEALLRWNDPHTGLVPPGQFIGILEETGLIHEVGRWALRTAVGDYLRWRAAGLPAVRLSVNVSPLQLRDQGFIAEIGRIIGVHADAPGGLELEVTESVVMDDVTRNAAVLDAVRAMGVTIAIDDFGTGFSSLSYLARLPVNTLKIDRSFVTAMASGEDAVTLVATIIRLAQSLDLIVVAEGVETEDQHRLLRLLGCDEMQGYLFSRPLSHQDFEKTFLMGQAGLTQ